jgi:arginine deiminase
MENHRIRKGNNGTDGCNLVAIKPGVALGYDRNPVTEKAFRDAGYDIIHACDFLEKYRAGSLNPDTLENTIIMLPSNELSRARGGFALYDLPYRKRKSVISTSYHVSA